jgi:SAM-dependent methyltransferase
MTFIKVLKKIYFLFFSRFIHGKIKIYDRHKTYEDYINKQLEKTLDPNRIKKWKGREWQIKVDGFRHLFKRNEEFLQNKKNSICLGARTGQEVFVLRELGLDSIGIDLVEFPPYTIKGDIHNLEFDDEKFDLIFTNILDHSLYLEKFISEMERVCVKDGIIIINITENILGDDYSENVINSPEPIIKIFKNSILIRNRKIKNIFDQMNRELVFKKIK